MCYLPVPRLNVFVIMIYFWGEGGLKNILFSKGGGGGR